MISKHISFMCSELLGKQGLQKHSSCSSSSGSGSSSSSSSLVVVSSSLLLLLLLLLYYIIFIVIIILCILNNAYLHQELQLLRPRKQIVSVGACTSVTSV